MSMRYQAGIVLPGYNALKVADAPTIGTASQASTSSISVPFTAPSCVGGGAISSYTAYCTTTGTNTASGASSPLTVTGLSTAVAYTFKVIATNAYGPSYPSASSNSVTIPIPTCATYTTPGTYSWVAPTGVTSVAAVVVGGGGSGGNVCMCTGNKGGGGGGGGALRYGNGISVTPGTSYTVTVGAGGVKNGGLNNAGNVATGSVFRGVIAYGGNGGLAGSTGGAGGCGTGGTGGYNGGAGGTGSYNGGSAAGGGGGAAGYAGNGGAGGTYSAASTAGSGGGGGGGGGSFNGAGGGGGIGLLGQGSNGGGGTFCGSGGFGGLGGSGGTNAPNSTQYRAPNNSTAIGGGSGGDSFTCGASTVNTGGNGAVRIVWAGGSRGTPSFPSTCVGA